MTPWPPRRNRVGFRFRSIALALALFLPAACAEEPVSRVERPVLLFGVDGATWDVIDPLLESGKLPNLRRLIRHGVRAPLSTLEPALSPRLWTTIATGVLPDEHGIVDFVVTDPRTGERELVSSNMRKVAAIWNILSESGYRVGIVNWWASYPAEPVNGFLVSDRANRHRPEALDEVLGLTGSAAGPPDPRACHPPALCRELARFLELGPSIDADLLRRVADFPPETVSALQAVPRYSRENRLSVLKFNLMMDEALARAGLHTLEESRPDFFSLYLPGLDGVEHHFWKYHEPAKFDDVPERETEIFGDVIANYYIYWDEVLGRFLAAYRDDPVTVIVLSDHGHEASPSHGPDATVPYARLASGTHDGETDGILILSGPDIVPGADAGRPSIVDVTPTLLALMGLPVAEDMPGKVLGAVIAPAFLRRHPVKRTPTYSADRVHSDEPVPSESDEELKERLKALGYIQ